MKHLKFIIHYIIPLIILLISSCTLYLNMREPDINIFLKGRMIKEGHYQIDVKIVNSGGKGANHTCIILSAPKEWVIDLNPIYNDFIFSVDYDRNDYNGTILININMPIAKDGTFELQPPLKFYSQNKIDNTIKYTISADGGSFKTGVFLLKI